MSLWVIIAAVFGLAALFGFLNYHLLRWPESIGIMTLALLLSVGLMLANALGANVTDPIQTLMTQVRFDATVLHGLLGFLLFAGALSVDWPSLRRNGVMVVLLATAGVLLTTLIVAGAMHLILGWLGRPLDWSYCLLFGALIAPTDPIAVLGLLKRVGVSKDLEMTIAGESLFNDGVGVTVFILLLPMVISGDAPQWSEGLLLFAREALGGIMFGLLAGWATLRLLCGIDQYTLEILLTLALVTGGFVTAEALTVSAPLAIVVAGLMLGHQGKSAMSERTRHHLMLFWHLLDELLNAILFLLIGLELVVLTLHLAYVGAMLLAIFVVLGARLLAVGVPFALFPRHGPAAPHAVPIMVWGGVRGGLSVAMALSLPAGDGRDLVVAMTYAVVLFGLLVQGKTLSWWLSRRNAQS